MTSYNRSLGLLITNIWNSCPMTSVKSYMSPDAIVSVFSWNITLVYGRIKHSLHNYVNLITDHVFGANSLGNETIWNRTHLYCFSLKKRVPVQSWCWESDILREPYAKHGCRFPSKEKTKILVATTFKTNYNVSLRHNLNVMKKLLLLIHFSYFIVKK